MFAKLTNSYPLESSIESKQTFIRQFFNELGHSDNSSMLEELSTSFESVIGILQNHSQITVQFVFEKMTIEDCINIMNQKHDLQQPSNKNVLLRILRHIGKHANSKKDQVYIEWFSKMFSKYSSLQKVLIFMRQLVENYQQKFQNEFVPEYLADFINGSRIVVQAYLKLKVQAPKFDIDYMQHGEKIIISTEIWLKNLYLEMLRTMRIPDTHALKLSTLNAICDIVGALMQVQRQGNIDNTICSEILTECYFYVKKITTIDELHQIYLKRLRQHKFNLPLYKIMIPTRYPSNTVTFPNQSYAFLVFQFLKQSIRIYSDQSIVNYLILVINELAQFEYEIKAEVEKLFVQKVYNGKVSLKTCFEGQFPLSILFFNLWHYQQKRNKTFLNALNQIYERMKNQNTNTFVNNLKVLNDFHAQNLDRQINQFIGEKALQIQDKHPELMVSLIKNIRWQNVNQKGEIAWKNVVTSMCKDNKLKSQLNRMLKSRTDKTPFEIELQKIVQN